ncbi:hypothetical protein HI914_01989 [Erysiphe necator]|nr:hypothetical protein HI914_01989 [Erysiphe necator]
MAPTGGIWALYIMNFFKQAARKTSKLTQVHISGLRTSALFLNPNKYFHQKATTFQLQKQPFTVGLGDHGTTRRLLDTVSSYTVKCNGSRYPYSKTADAILKTTGRTPFTCILRSDLTAGIFPQTGVSYGIGGGCYGSARFFSHTPTPLAQVIQKVSGAFRTFELSRKRAPDCVKIQSVDRKIDCSYYSENLALGQCYRHHETHSLGSYIDFNIKPTLICFFRLDEDVLSMNDSEQYSTHLNTVGLLEEMSNDFSRITKDLSTIMNDIKSLSSLGNLPITWENFSTIRVHFPGHDSEYVERLCNDLGIQRGVVHQKKDRKKVEDENISLVFPYAPNSVTNNSSTYDLWPHSRDESVRSHRFDESCVLDHTENKFENSEGTLDSQNSRGKDYSSNYEYTEEINRFLKQCEHLNRF